jgi:hypothetical protein
MTYAPILEGMCIPQYPALRYSAAVKFNPRCVSGNNKELQRSDTADSSRSDEHEDTALPERRQHSSVVQANGSGKRFANGSDPAATARASRVCQNKT